MIFSRKKHKLPKFPPTVIPAFNSVCRTMSMSEVEGLKLSLAASVKELHNDFNQDGQTDIKVAEKIAEQCRFLLDNYGNYSPEQQALIVGAVSYFAASDDPFSDKDFASGLDDDVKVINYVLEELGVEDRFIDLSF